MRDKRTPKDVCGEATLWAKRGERSILREARNECEALSLVKRLLCRLNLFKKSITKEGNTRSSQKTRKTKLEYTESQSNSP